MSSLKNAAFGATIGGVTLLILKARQTKRLNDAAEAERLRQNRLTFLR